MTNTEEIKALLKASEFHSFEIHLKTGKVFHVEHPDFAWVRPLSGALLVVDSNQLFIVSANEIDYVRTDERALENE